ncbi:MAG TPA: flagellin [bacterium]|nr:flagellin [bacterium]
MMGIQGVNNSFPSPPERKMSYAFRSEILRSLARLSADSALETGPDSPDGVTNLAPRQNQIPELNDSLAALQAGISQATVTGEGLQAIAERIHRIGDWIQQTRSEDNLTPKILQDRQEKIRTLIDEIGRISETTRMAPDPLLFPGMEEAPNREAALDETTLLPAGPVPEAGGDSTALTEEDMPRLAENLEAVFHGADRLGEFLPGSLGLGPGRTLNGIDITREGGLDEAQSITEAALAQVNDNHTAVGIFLSRLENTTQHLAVMSENLRASRPRILETDFAAESTRLAVRQVMMQARVSIHAQVNHLFSHMFTDLLR